MQLVKGNLYKFEYQSEILVYIGKSGVWNQFCKEDNVGIVWCELLDKDLWMIEEVDSNQLRS